MVYTLVLLTSDLKTNGDYTFRLALEVKLVYTKYMADKSDYTPEMLEKAQEYLDNCPDPIHTIEGLTDYLGKARSTIYKWLGEADKKDFSDTVERIKVKQAKMLIENGLNGTFNPSITKLMLGTNHGYVDKQETDLTTKGKELTPMLVQFIDEPNSRDTEGV